MAGDAFVVVDAVAAAVQDQLAAEHLDRPRVVRGVTVDEIDAAADQPVREADLIRADPIAPVGSPVDGDDHDITGPLGRPRPADEVIGGRVGQIGQQVDAGPARGGGPARRDPAGGRPAGEDHHAAAAGHRDGRRPPGLTGIPPGAHPPQPGSGHRVQGVLQPSAAEIEHVVVRQRAGIGPGRGQARNVTRTHPVVNSLARREAAAPGDAGLQVDHPDIRRGILQDRQRVAPGPGKACRPRDPAMGPLRQADVRPRIGGVSLPQFRIARVRQNLVHAAASHHITAQEQGQQTIAHLTHCARPPAAPRNRRPAAKRRSTA